MKKRTFLYILIPLLFLSCVKEEPKPDSIPYYDMFRCKINGELYTPYCEGNILWGCNPIDCQYYKDTKSFEIAVNNTSKMISISMYKYGIELGDNQLQNGQMFNQNLEGNCKYYAFDSLQANNLIINYIDTINQMIQGNFEITLTHGFTGCNKDTIYITEGYFNVPYRR